MDQVEIHFERALQLLGLKELEITILRERIQVLDKTVIELRATSQKDLQP